MENSLWKSVLLRFIRAFIAGAAAQMALILVFNGSTWEDVTNWLMALGISAIVGGITGLIMAVDKYFRGN